MYICLLYTWLCPDSRASDGNNREPYTSPNTIKSYLSVDFRYVLHFIQHQVFKSTSEFDGAMSNMIDRYIQSFVRVEIVLWEIWSTGSRSGGGSRTLP